MTLSGCGAKRSKSDFSNNNLFSPLDFILSALRKSMASTCRQEQEEVISPVHQMEIGWPTNVEHVTHVTFDGLPLQLPPSPSASVCGVSPNSMQRSYDTRSNSVPTILILMQERLYSLGGLKVHIYVYRNGISSIAKTEQVSYTNYKYTLPPLMLVLPSVDDVYEIELSIEEAEGIFRINPENSKEEYVRDQLNRGIVPENIDVHRLAGLIKAWFRELPCGVLDGLSPEQVLECSTEDEFVDLVKELEPTKSRLLGWAIDLMADVAEQEESNKMNVRNIAMVFAPNMTQMSDPLTALMHAVQVMNLLKTLILKKLRDRKESESGRHSPLSSFDRPKDEKSSRLHESDTSCGSTTGQPSEDEGEDRDEIESLSETEDCFLRPTLNVNEGAKDGFRKQLETILCSRDNNGSCAFYADTRVSFSDSRVGSSCISTSDDDESRLSSIAFRSRDGCKKRTRHDSRDQYLLTNNVFSQYSPV